jgi:hypothetical protein
MGIGCLPCNHTRRLTGATPTGASSGVNALVGEGLAICSGRSIKRTLQPRDTTCVRTDERRIVDVEPLRNRRKTRAGCEATTICNSRVHRGTGDGTAEKTHAVNWGPSRGHAWTRPKGTRPAWTKQISRREGPRGADEAIVAVTLRDSITRGRAKGLWAGMPDRLTRMPLGRKALYGKSSAVQLHALIRSEQEKGLALRIRHRSAWGMRASRLTQRPMSKVAVDCQLEAVLGKTRRLEGEEETC